MSYITKLDNDIKDYNDFNISENMLYDDIRETIAILGSELPNDIDKKLLWKNGNGVSDDVIHYHFLSFIILFFHPI